MGDIEWHEVDPPWSVLLPAVGKDKMEFISLFQKCVHLESSVICDGCSSVFAKNGFSMLSHFPKLTYFNQLKVPNHFCATSLHNIVTSLNTWCFMKMLFIITTLGPHIAAR